MAKPMEIGIYTRYFVVAGIDRQYRQHVTDFAGRFLTKYDLMKIQRKWIMAPTKVYATANKDRSIWRMPIGMLSKFKEHLGRIPYIESLAPKYSPTSVDLRNVSKYAPRDNQPTVIDYLNDPAYPTKLVELQTGKGKTFCTFMSLLHWKLRSVIIVPKMYIDRWADDLPNVIGLDASKRELLIIRSGKDLSRLIEYAKTKEYRNTKIICITTGCIETYIKTWKETYISDQYTVPPWELMAYLGIGVKVVDEIHKNFHKNQIIDLWLNYPISINLSATMEHSDKDQNRFYDMFFPNHTRCPKIPYDKYIDVKEYTYYLKPNSKLEYIQPGMKTYSHPRFENSIKKHVKSLNSWLLLLTHIFDREYFKIRQKGEKLLVLCSTRMMVGLVYDEMKAKYPDENIGKYLQEDEYDVLDKFEIIISTEKSAGTAVDIKGLVTAVLTIGMESRQANEQCLGRTRALSGDEERYPRFVFMTCMDIDKHRDYAISKKKYFGNKCRSLITTHSGFEI